MTEETTTNAPPILFNASDFSGKMHIQDSGQRTQFSTGAVRDLTKGKGRCDLLPIMEVCELLAFPEPVRKGLSQFNMAIDAQNNAEFYDKLLFATHALGSALFGDVHTAVLEASIHYEEGAEKYREHNWKLGLPLFTFLSSSLRHLIKHFRGDSDERHDRAVIWNLLCALWTSRNHINSFDEYYGRRFLK